MTFKMSLRDRKEFKTTIATLTGKDQSPFQPMCNTIRKSMQVIASTLSTLHLGVTNS